jgi:hypothetical protein
MTASPDSVNLVATPSTTVRNKNILLILMVAGFCGWFTYDGLVGYVKSNDKVLAEAREKYKDELTANIRARELLETWPGWDNATPQQQQDATVFMRGKPESWHNPLDMKTQKIISVCLAGVTIITIWWFFHCQRRRAIANAQTLSPARGVEIPWSSITKIDNTKWKKSGIVWITYKENNEELEAKLDDYHLDKLRPILQLMEEKCPHAELISPPDEEESKSDSKSQDAKKE